jgi:hypothetical protein
MLEFPRGFPLRTLVVCFTVWLIATEVLVFDQIKFDTRTHLLEQAARGFHGPEVIVPNEQRSRVPSGATMQTTSNVFAATTAFYPVEGAMIGSEVIIKIRQTRNPSGRSE